MAEEEDWRATGALADGEEGLVVGDGGPVVGVVVAVRPCDPSCCPDVVSPVNPVTYPSPRDDCACFLT
jgi:hypothetical protein